MISESNKRRHVCSELTKTLIDLHDSGYVFDFRVLDRERIICLQDSRQFNANGIIIKVINQHFDKITHSYKYIHTVETDCGDRGLIVADEIITNQATQLMVS